MNPRIEPTRMHSRFAPSSLKRILACPLSVRLSEAMILPPEVTSFYAAEGTCAHALAEMFLHDPNTAWAEGTIVEVPPHEITVDEEMFVAAYMFADLVNNLRGDETWTEQRVRLDEVVGDIGCYGHLDAGAWDRQRRVLSVADFKYGRGIAVRVENNPQLMAYALGALHSLVPPSQRTEVEHIALYVSQPRLGDAGVHRHNMTRAELESWGSYELAPTLQMIHDETYPDDLMLNPGEHCQFCPVRMQCPALHSLAQTMAKQVFSNGADPDLLAPIDNDSLGAILDQAALLEPWFEIARALAKSRLELGGEIPNWKLVRQRGHRVWTAGERETVSALIGGGVDPGEIYSTPKLRSAAQIEKLVPDGFKEEFRGMWRMEHPGTTLAPRSDVRPEAPPEISKAFTKLP